MTNNLEEIEAAEIAKLVKKISLDDAHSMRIIGELGPMVDRDEAQALYRFAVRLTRLLAPTGDRP